MEYIKAYRIILMFALYSDTIKYIYIFFCFIIVMSEIFSKDTASGKRAFCEKVNFTIHLTRNVFDWNKKRKKKKWAGKVSFFFLARTKQKRNVDFDFCSLHLRGQSLPLLLRWTTSKEFFLQSFELFLVFN